MSLHAGCHNQALRSVEVDDPEAAEKANREFITDESDDPLFKLGVIQALRYRNPKVLFGDGSESGWMNQVTCSKPYNYFENVLSLWRRRNCGHHISTYMRAQMHTCSRAHKCMHSHTPSPSLSLSRTLAVSHSLPLSLPFFLSLSHIQVVAAGAEASEDGRRTKPHFMVLGSSKCGTSSLVRYLTAMPCIGLSLSLPSLSCLSPPVSLSSP